MGGFFALIVWSPAFVGFLFAGEHTLFSIAYKVKIKFSCANKADSKKTPKNGVLWKSFFVVYACCNTHITRP